jgi:acetyl-CoA acetyltransferase
LVVLLNLGLGRGAFSETSSADLLAPVLKKLIDETGVRPQDVDDLIIGKASGDTGRGLVAVRIASFLAGFPKETSCVVLNRACSSGLQSIAAMHASINAG